MKAAHFAAKCHSGQVRKFSGDPYIIHPISVANKISNNHQEQSLIIAALLHDTIEDCDVKYEDILQHFGRNVAELVKSVTNSCFEGSRAGRKLAEFSRIAKCSTNAKILKLYDRLDNVEDLESRMISGNATKSFCVLYARESAMLIDMIGDSDDWCAGQIENVCSEILRKSEIVS